MNPITELTEEAAGILARVEDQAAYISAAIAQRNMMLHESVETLRTAGWLVNETQAALGVLNGELLVSCPTHLGACMLEEESFVCAAEYEIPKERWEELANDVLGDESLAFALWIVCSEFWTHNTRAAQLVDELEKKTE